MTSRVDVIIIGGGLAGLSCAKHMVSHGLSCRLLEASDQVGGRVRTDAVEGFLLDRGFQVFLTAYPEAEAILNYEALALRSFNPGALIRSNGKFHRLADPFRQPNHALATALSPVATLADKLRIARFRSDMQRGDLEALYVRPGQSTMDLLRGRGFSTKVIERFFKPFLGGIFLEPELQTSSRMGEFVFRMFGQGDAALPEVGMGAIPQQLADALPGEVIRTSCRVVQLETGPTDSRVVLESGEELASRAVVIATESPSARNLLGESVEFAPAADPCGVCNLYFAADTPPLNEPTLVLNGDGPESGPINNLAVPSLVSPRYAPAGKSLVSVAVLGATLDESNLLDRVVQQLIGWFGPVVSSWRHLKTYQIPYALPSQIPPALDPVARPAQVHEGVYIAGDHCDTASINGAFASGRRAAEAVLHDLAPRQHGRT